MSFTQTYFGEVLSELVAYDLRNSFYDKVQHQSFGFHDRNHTGNLMSRAITDVENIRMFINMGLVRSPYFLFLFIAVAVILLTIDWRLGLLSTSFLPFVAINSGMVRLKMRLIWTRVQEKMAELNTVLQENLTGVRVVKAFAAETHEEVKYNTRNADVAAEMVEAEKLRASNTSFTTFTFYIALALILWFARSAVGADARWTSLHRPHGRDIVPRHLGTSGAGRQRAGLGRTVACRRCR